MHLFQLHQPSPNFDLGDPYSRHLRTEYNSLHDPHLQDYHNRKDNLQNLKNRGLVTNAGKVVCTLKEFNEYRQYLTRLKLEQEKIKRQEEVGKTWCWEARVSGMAPRARALLDGSEGDGECRRGEGWAGGAGTVAWKGQPCLGLSYRRMLAWGGWECCLLAN
ncbi:fibrous sheath-interacting protein 2-like [Phasianus colchicus]|uniref:fibrous sheath-interacting protein 2-like n=1 Tax=Phasianus colchicus TaxID=9054 RepID=UPI00129D671B|nr:fibrous sheath-interacting protein 2-like [Phasianus colchicus]